MLKDRTQAGKLLAIKLSKYKSDSAILIAVPRGGVPVAYPIARELCLPLELALTRKILHPNHKEYAIGAASLSDYFAIPHNDVSQACIEKELSTIRTRLKEMQRKFMGDHESEKLKGKTVIVIDDGAATGNTLLGTIRVIRKAAPAKIVIAVPVASTDAIHKLKQEADDVIALQVPEEFYGVGAFYQNFKEVSDEEVIFYLEKLSRLKKAG